jgi:hypothetical protein
VDEWAVKKKLKKQPTAKKQSSLLRHFGSASSNASNATFLLPENGVTVEADAHVQAGDEDISQPLVDFAKIQYVVSIFLLFYSYPIIIVI